MNFSDPTGALQRYQQALGSGRQSYDQALAQQLATMQQPVDRRGALMRMAQGFLSPTKTGGFAENLGLAVGNYADANDKARDQEMDRTMKLAQIQAARAKLQMEGAQNEFGLFEKGYGMEQQRRKDGMLDMLYGGGSPQPGSIQEVAGLAEKGMTAIPGGFEGTPILDPMGFNAPLSSGNVTRANARNAPMPGDNPAAPMTEDGVALPRRENIVPPGPAPMQELGALPAEAMAEYASGSGQNPLFSPQMAITPEQMQQFRPQQAPVQQQAPAQPQQQAPAQGGLTGSDAVFTAAEQQRARLQGLAQQNPAIRSLPEYREEMKRVDDILLKADTPLIREYRAFQNETPNWAEIAPSLAHFKRMGAANVTVGGQQDPMWGNAPGDRVWLRGPDGNVVTEPDPSGRGVRPVAAPIPGSQAAIDAEKREDSGSRTSRWSSAPGRR